MGSIAYFSRGEKRLGLCIACRVQISSTQIKAEASHALPYPSTGDAVPWVIEEDTFKRPAHIQAHTHWCTRINTHNTLIHMHTELQTWTLTHIHPHILHTRKHVCTHTQARAYKTQTYHENYIFLQGQVIFSIYREVSLGPLEIQYILQINYVTYTKSQIKRTFKNINQKTRWVNFVNYLFIVFNNKTIIQWNGSDNRMKKKTQFSV